MPQVLRLQIKLDLNFRHKKQSVEQGVEIYVHPVCRENRQETILVLLQKWQLESFKPLSN